MTTLAQFTDRSLTVRQIRIKLFNFTDQDEILSDVGLTVREVRQQLFEVKKQDEKITDNFFTPTGEKTEDVKQTTIDEWNELTDKEADGPVAGL